MSALSLPTELRREVDATGRTSVFSCNYFELVAVHPVNKTFNAGLDIKEKRLKLIRRSRFRQLGIISVFLIITLVATYQVREGLRVQCEQDWPKDRTLRNPELKGAGRGRDVVNHHRLFTAL